MGMMAASISRIPQPASGVEPQFCSVKHRRASFIGVVVVFFLALSPATWECFSADSSPPVPAPTSVSETNFQTVLLGYLQLQEQLHAAQLGIEQNRQEARAAADQNAKALTKGLLELQQAFSVERARELKATRDANQVMLTVVGTFAAIGILTMLTITYFQWRTSNSLALISSTLPMALGLSPGAPLPALGPGNAPVPASGPAEQSSQQLRGAMGRLDRRTQELARKSSLAAERPKGSSIEHLFFAAPGDSFRKRQSQAVKLAVLIGLFCGGVLALLISKW
jgi:hypothetical protein